MAFTKKKKAEFERIIQKGLLIMPKEFRKRTEVSLFEEEEMGSKPAEFKPMRFELCYIRLAENKNGDPMPKQSFRQSVQRGKDGNVFVFTNKLTGKKDVILRGYTEAKVTTTKDSLVMQLQAIMTRDYKGHRPFSKDVHITRCEFIFNPLLGASKKDQEAMKNDEYIVFKSTKPDLDNLEKMLWDACEEAGVMTNDSQIASKNGIFKHYGSTPGVIVELEGRL